MNFRSIVVVMGLLCQLAAQSTAAEKGQAKSSPDSALAAARKLVEKSDRYMHHSKLRRDMEGYGLTVLAGTKIVRFGAKIVSVVTQWGPHQDLILARLSGQGLEKTGIISGMSGSPVYIRDKDGKDKLIGAIAYGWSGHKIPVCGIQPITQMLVVAAEPPGKGGKGRKVARGKAASGAAMSKQGFIEAVLRPEKRDFSGFGWPERLLKRRPKASASGALVPLITPLMVRGMGARTMSDLGELLSPAGLMPVKAGGVNAPQAKEAAGAKLEPGAAIAVPLVTGDSDYSAVGTVTDVLDGRVLAFGHSFYAEGDVEFPMGPAYVHTVVPTLMRSFKLSSQLGITGTLNRDGQTGVAGRIGPKPQMIPMTVNVHWKNDRRKQTYRYKLCRHRYLTASLTRMLMYDAAWGWRELPTHHTVRYSVAVEFEKLGKYSTSNISSGNDVYWALSDLTRPIVALMDNPYGKPAKVTNIGVTITIDSGNINAQLLAFKLDGQTYRPGETLTGKVTLQRFRKPRTTLPVKFKLPADLPEGSYTLQACNWTAATSRLQSEMPHRFDPRNPEQLLASIRRTVQMRGNVLYLRLPVKKGSGLAIRKQELPDLPDSRARIIAQADNLNTRRFSRAVVQKMPTDYVLTGSTSAAFKVVKRPKETLIRKQGN